MTERAKFTNLIDSTADDWRLIRGSFLDYAAKLPDRLLAHLALLDGDFGGFRVDRLTHVLETATRAFRDGRDEEYVVCALVHDIGDTLACYNHPAVAAAIVELFVSDDNHWMVEKHQIFQGYYFFAHVGADRNARERFRGHPAFERTAEFCEKYDSPAFTGKDVLPLEFFEPMVRRVFAKPKRTLVERVAATTNTP